MIGLTIHIREADFLEAVGFFDDLPETINKNIKDVYEFMIPEIERYSKINSPVDTGTLKGSIRGYTDYGEKEDKITGVIESRVEYSCVFGANTMVKTKNGLRTISSINIGDEVLTQDGTYRKVVAKSRIDATEKPNLIDIEVFWRKGKKKHKITLTEDHKVLTKINGSFTWIEAGELKEGSIVLTPRKPAYNKGIGKKYTIKICKHCGKEYQGQGRFYCSVECRDEVYRTNHPQTGDKRSEEARKRIKEANIKKLKENLELHPNRILARKGKRTSCKMEVKEWLDLAGVKYEEEKKIGRHYVDFYCPELNAIFEADGAYWHQNQEKDIERDLSIRKELPDVKIIHIHFADKRFSKDIDHTPVENVHYIQVNPSMNSYVDVEVFQETEVLKVRKWQYKRTYTMAGLYDLSVEGVHSYVANGILISNCFVHEGTRYMRARPFILDAIMNKAKVKMRRELERNLLKEKRGLI